MPELGWLTPSATQVLALSVIRRTGARRRLKITVPAARCHRTVGKIGAKIGAWVARLVGRPAAPEMRHDGVPQTPGTLRISTPTHREARALDLHRFERRRVLADPRVRAVLTVPERTTRAVTASTTPNCILASSASPSGAFLDASETF